jgi:hypothetical protein
MIENYYKSQADHYQKAYFESQDRLSELNFQIGWLRASLARLGQLVESGDVTASKYYKSTLDNIVDALEESEKQAKKYLGEIATAE